MARALTDMRVEGCRAGRQANPPVVPEPESTANPRASGQRPETRSLEKLLRSVAAGPYRKPTQVVEESIQRCSSDPWLRN